MDKLEVGEVQQATYRVGMRDAFHVPAVLVTGDRDLEPGTRVRFAGNMRQVYPCGPNQAPHGVVDPFLRQAAQYDEEFWVFLMPGTTSNLVHHFDVKGFDENGDDDNNDECRLC